MNKCKRQSIKMHKKKAKRATPLLSMPRQGWPAAFRKMTKHGDDALIDIGRSMEQWPLKEWK